MAEKNKPDDEKKSEGKKRSAVVRVLLAVLIIFILFLLLYVVDAFFDLGVFGNRKGGGSRAGAGGSAGTAVAVDAAGIGAGAGVGADSASIGGASADSVSADSGALAGQGTLPVLSDRERAVRDSLARVRAALRARRADSLATLARALADSLALSDSLARVLADSLARADSIAQALADSVARADSVALALADSLDMVRAIAVADSIARVKDSLARVVDPCARDTLKPWVYPDPSGGLHRKAVSVGLVANKKCKVEWSFDGVADWKVYDGKPIAISKPATLYYRAVDSCGKKMDVRSKRYEFDLSGAEPLCPPDMEYIKADGKEFCIDVYEWPNRKGAVPRSYVSLYQAMDSCFSVRKRLCSSEEWTSACGGPEKWKYLYGESYESNACATRDTSVQRSGGRPECRGYYAVFDMAGNLAEWTSTPSPQNRSFNNVMGGYWESGNQSRCADARYSYFPQNRHNPVGFRCCRDVSPQPGGPARPKGSGR